MGQGIQILGALVILAAFALVQGGIIDSHSLRYLGLNVAGATVLSLNALFERQWGFLLLEVVWATISLIGVLSRARTRLVSNRT